MIVTDTGFGDDTWAGQGVDLPSDADLTQLFDTISNSPLIRIDFPDFADGRGFTLAAQLRRMGYKGHLRAKGHVIADQYAMARRAGFDDVEIDDALAKRQGQEQWRARSDWQNHSYQNRMRG